MAKILLAWEAGAFLGHELLVTAASVLLSDAGHDVVIAAPHGSNPNGAVRRARVEWVQAPPMPEHRAPVTGFSWESRATALWNFGFHSADVIGDRFHAWDVVLHRQAPDAVVLQAAPFAQLSARMAGMPSVEFGIGFDVPPSAAPFPPFRGAQAFDPTAALSFEQAILDRVRRSLGGLARDSLAAHVSGDRRLAVSIPELDHYDGHADATREFIGPLPMVEFAGERPQWRLRRPRVLAYVRASLVDSVALVKALAGLRGDAVLVCPGADEATAALARRLGVRLYLEPMSIGDLLAGADLVVSHGGGLMAEALVRGRPCLALPSHYEQFMTASTLKKRRLGTLVNPKEPALYERAIRHVLADTEARRNAAAVGKRCQDMTARTGANFVSAVEAVVEGGGP